MKLPEVPPNYFEVFKDTLLNEPEKVAKLAELTAPTDKQGRYLHWDELKYRVQNKRFTPEQWWAGVKFARQNLLKKTHFKAKNGKPFCYSFPDFVLEALHWLDQRTAGNISTESLIPGIDKRKEFLIKSYIDEAISSSQLEGAATTRKVAKQMLLEGRPPKDTSEQMIYNNYQAMQFILRLQGSPLSSRIILKLHKILTEDTMENPQAAGRFRDSDDIHIFDDRDGTILHTPPKATELPKRIELLCKFANETTSSYFIHPIIRAIILHFMLAYDHPFEDGNGRVARALFYWSAVNSGFWLMEYISISTVIKKAPWQYGKAFLYTETDEGDLTYFLIHQLKVIRKAIDDFLQYLKENIEETRSALQLLEANPTLKASLNYRQIELLKHTLKNPKNIYTIAWYKGLHGISYETARRDLLEMSEKFNLLDKTKSGKAFIFISPEDIQERMKVNGKQMEIF